MNQSVVANKQKQKLFYCYMLQRWQINFCKTAVSLDRCFNMLTSDCMADNLVTRKLIAFICFQKYD